MLSKDRIYSILSNEDPACLEDLIARAEAVRIKNIGNDVYIRGLIEFSNRCYANCYYCGLRKSNHQVTRYSMPKEEIVNLALYACDSGLQSLALQAGENRNKSDIDFIADVIATIKELTARDGSPGLGITLSIGEHDYHSYKKLFDAGAHRYLLRIETSDPVLFSTIHPPSQSLDRRIACLDDLKSIGYQVGTGIMVGLPGQNLEHIIKDLEFFQEKDIDMLGMGPFIPQTDTPFAHAGSSIIKDSYSMTLKVMALARILMPDINMVASTALQSVNPKGLSAGIKAGANIIMPVLTPELYRESYIIYDNKKYKPLEILEQEVVASGYHITYGQWGDSLHYFKRIEEKLR